MDSAKEKWRWGDEAGFLSAGRWSVSPKSEIIEGCDSRDDTDSANIGNYGGGCSATRTLSSIMCISNNIDTRIGGSRSKRKQQRISNLTSTVYDNRKHTALHRSNRARNRSIKHEKRKGNDANRPSRNTTMTTKQDQEVAKRMNHRKWNAGGDDDVRDVNPEDRMMSSLTID